MGESDFQNASVPSQSDHLKGQFLAALGHGGLYSPLNAAAAGDLHTDHQHIPDRIAPQNFRELFRIVALVQLGAADGGNPARHETGVEVRAGEGGAVCCHQQRGAVIKRSFHRQEFELYRPLGQGGQRCGGILTGGGGNLGGTKCLGPAAGTAAAPDRSGALQRGSLLGQYRSGVVGSSLPLDKADAPVGQVGRQSPSPSQ